MNLRTNTFLQSGKYRVLSVLGQGGFGITYLVEHTLLDKKYAIKEFFPKDFCNRDSSDASISIATQSNTALVETLRNKFIKEARKISTLDHPGIVEIHDIFEENGTAYYVMDYIEGTSLDKFVKANGAMEPVTAIKLIHKVGDSLRYIHSLRMNHLDVKPSNIMLRKANNEPILIDFGLAKQYDDQGQQTSTTPSGISRGYAAIEQYRQGGVSSFTPQTDIYSLGATLLYMLTGNVPPEPTTILEESIDIGHDIKDKAIGQTIAKAMEIKKTARHTSVEEFLAELLNAEAETNTHSGAMNTAETSSETEETKLITEANEPNDIAKLQKELESLRALQKSSNEALLEEQKKNEQWEKYCNEYEAEKERQLSKSKYIIIFLVTITLLVFIISCSNEEPEYTETSNNYDYHPISELVEEAEEVQPIAPHIEIRNNNSDNPSVFVEEAEEAQSVEQYNQSSTIKKETVETSNNNTKTQTASSKIPISDNSNGISKHENATKNDIILESVEKSPIFPGGKTELAKFINTNLHYPTVAQEEGIQGSVRVKFVVTQSGDIGEIKVIRSRHPELDKEAVRIIKMLPKFIPGEHNGKKVKVWHTILIPFKLNSNNKPLEITEVGIS